MKPVLALLALGMPIGFAVPTPALSNTVASPETAETVTYTAGAVGINALSCQMKSSTGVISTASTNATVIPAPATPVITAASLVIAGATGLTASVPDQAGCTFAWILSNGTITAGAGTRTITYRVGAVGTSILKCTVKNSAGTAAAATVSIKVVATRATIVAPSPSTTLAAGLMARVPDTAGASYAWTISNGTITSSTTASSIVYSVGNVGTTALGCTVTAGGTTSGTKNISIVAVPTAQITAATPVTAGKAGCTASVPPQSGCTYAWTVSSGNITAGAGTRTITYTAGPVGPFTVACTVKNAAGTVDSKTKTISAIPAPVATITATTPVTTGTANLSASVPDQDGCGYAWTITNGVITDGPDTRAITYTAGATGTVTLKCTVTNAAGTILTGTKAIAAVALPRTTITAASPVTAGHAGLTASVPAQTGCMYAWTIGNGTITAGASSHAITYTAGAIGTVSLSCTVTNAAGKALPGNASISAITAPVASISTYSPVVTGSAGLSAAVPAQPGCTYAWALTNASVTSGAGTPTITYKAGATGTATLKCTVKNAANTAITGTQAVLVVATKATIVSASPVTESVAGLTAAVPNTAGATYAWNATNATITSATDTNAITYTAGGAGSVQLTCAVTASGTMITGNRTINVIAAPDATIQAVSPVTTGTASLAASVPSQPGCTFAWSIVNGHISAGATTRSITYSVGTPLLTTLICTVKNAAGTSITKSKELSVVAAPVASITAAASVYAGTTGLSASVPSQSGCTYVWVLTNASVTSGAGSSGIHYTAGGAGTATLKCTVTNAAGTSLTGTKSVTVIGAPVVAIAPAGPIHINTTGTIGFKPQVTGASDARVTWTVDGIPNGNTTVGTLSTNGRFVMYTAPAQSGVHTLTALSVVDPQATASVALTVASSCAPAPTSGLDINVKDAPYNAKGDGVCDDTAAIQAAVNAAGGTGGTVTIPAGTYLINPIANYSAGIRLKSNMTLKIASGATLQAMSTSTSHYIVLLASNVQNVSIVGGGAVIGNRTNNTITDSSEAGIGVEVWNSKHVVVEGLTVQDCWCDGCYVGGASEDVTMNNLVVDRNRRHAMAITSVNGMIVRGSTFRNSIGLIENGILVCGTGIDIEPNAGETVANVQFLGCTFTSNASDGLTFGVAESLIGQAFVQNILAEGGTSNGNGTKKAGCGIGVCATSGNQVSNNLVTDTMGIGIYLRDGSDENLVIGNTVTKSVSAPAPAMGWIGYGVLLSQSGGNTVTGNTITHNAAAGIKEQSPTYTNITSPNTLSDNGTPP